jgi:hypothetical protein
VFEIVLGRGEMDMYISNRMEKNRWKIFSAYAACMAFRKP